MEGQYWSAWEGWEGCCNRKAQEMWSYVDLSNYYDDGGQNVWREREREREKINSNYIKRVKHEFEFTLV